MDSPTLTDREFTESIKHAPGLTVASFTALTTRPPASPEPIAPHAVTIRLPSLQFGPPGVPQPPGPSMRALLRAVSREAVTLLTPKRVAAKFDLVLPGHADQGELIITCACKSIRKIAAGQYHVDGTFNYFSMTNPANTPSAAAAA